MSSAGRFVFIGGEAGVGKTSLVRRFCASQSVRVLSGACDALATPHPLGPLLDIAHTTAGDLEALIVRGARPHEVAAALLDQLRSDPPCVVILEDLHWADDATLDVIRLLARCGYSLATSRPAQRSRASPSAPCRKPQSRSSHRRTAWTQQSCTATPAAIRSSSRKYSQRAATRCRQQSRTLSSRGSRA